jgi:phosphoglycolate phosphatase-like HAD superfamily hydrolase
MSDLLHNCKSVIFDCDGVILQSNRLKSDAFGQVLKKYDPKDVEDFVSFHKKTGGVSRFEKFAFFFREKLNLDDWEKLTFKACEDFGEIIFDGLCHCQLIPGFGEFLSFLEARKISLSVNTGGAQNEIRDVFRQRDLLDRFQIVLGSPDTKYDNMIKIQELGLIEPGTVYFGDSRLDFDLAQSFNLRFVYVGYESEWPEGEETTIKAGGIVISDYRNYVQY